MSGSAPAGAEVTEAHFQAAARKVWGVEGAETKPLRLGLTCRGKDDYVGGFVRRVDQEEVSFDVLIVTRLSADETEAAGQGEVEDILVRIPIDGHDVFSLDQGEAGYRLVAEEMDPATAEALAGAPVCESTLLIEGEQGDIIRLFWLTEVEGNQPEARIFLFKN